MPYEENKIYEFQYRSTITGRDGRQYMVVTDGHKDYTIKPYDFQIEYNIIPNTIRCFLKSFSISGQPLFEQERMPILEDRYTPGETHSFTVKEVHIDARTAKPYYMLADEFGLKHIYYPGDSDSGKLPGSNINLLVKSIIPAHDEKNNARLDFEARPTAVRVYPVAIPNYPKYVGLKNFGTENEKKEFKSSIVYPAGKTTPDIDEQLGIICRTIAGFMNSNGGTLYIGVSDNGYICGIENDYSHLNDGRDNYTYKANDDHYMLKITNRICDCLGKMAGTLISMRIEKADGHKYCIVEISKAPVPIWFNEEKLFVRMVTTNRLLKGNDITNFILDRVSKNSFQKQRENEKPIVDTYPTENEPLPTPVSPEPKHTSRVTRSGNAWRHITFYSDGDWSFQKNSLQDPDIVCNAEIPSDAKRNSLILIIAYENGCIEAVKLSKVLYGRNGLLPEGKKRGQGLYKDNGNVIATFCVKKDDMLLLMTEKGGCKYVKAIDVDTLGIHDKMGKGNNIVHEKGAVLVNTVCVPDNEGNRISLKGSGIFIEKNQKYYKGGVQFDTLDSKYQNLIKELSAAI